MNPNEKAARRRDNAIAAGAVLAGGGVAAGGYGAIRAAKAIKPASTISKKEQSQSHVQVPDSEPDGSGGNQVQRTSEQTADQVGGQVQRPVKPCVRMPAGQERQPERLGASLRKPVGWAAR